MTRMILLLSTFLISASAFAHGISEADKAALIDGGYLRYVSLGASHMLTGYDHLLFLFGVMFFLTRFKDIVKFITAFTLGHTITLITATYMGIAANYYLIDAIIALTVIYKGFDNVKGFQKYFGMEKSPNLLLLVFVFGLIHGFGLSTRLQQLPLGEDGLLMRIISFNVGVELGQIVALAVMLALLTVWRRKPSFGRLASASNLGLMIVGGLLFIMQMHGLLHHTSADDLKFSDNQHRESHAEDPLSLLMPSAAADDEPLIIPMASVPPSGSARFQVTIPADGSKEYKLYMVQDGTIGYQWKSDSGSLFYDLHGEPAGDTTGYFKSFKKDTAVSDQGNVTSPFDGTVGWYWRNRSTKPVTVTVQVSGTYIIMDGMNKQQLANAIAELKRAMSQPEPAAASEEATAPLSSPASNGHDHSDHGHDHSGHGHDH